MKKSKQLWSAILGNLFEHYDTALFGFLSPFLAPLIFPKEEPLTALLYTFAIIPLGMLARPLGALYFGRRGDRIGSAQTLSYSLFGMAILSAMIALTPTYSQAGFLSPLLFCLGRILQNFVAAGEVMGGAIFVLENTPEKKRDLLSGLYNASTIAGILCASMAVTLITLLECLWAWRILYCIGAITGFAAYFLREGPREIVERQTLASLWNYKKEFFLIVLASGFSYATYSIATLLMNGLIPLVTPYSKEQMIKLNTSLLLFDFAALPIFGWIAQKISRHKLMLFSSCAAAILAFPLFMLIPQATLPMLVFVRGALILAGVAFAAPFHAWGLSLLPANVRYTLLSFGYAIGAQFFGGTAAAISLWCYKQTHLVPMAALYWFLLAAVNGITFLFTQKQKVTVS